MQLYYIQDPGHGWISSDLDTLERLGIAGKISHCSYRERAPSRRVWLEEDCDAGILLDALRAAGEPFTIREEHLDADAWIRNLPSYASVPAGFESFSLLDDEQRLHFSHRRKIPGGFDYWRADDPKHFERVIFLSPRARQITRETLEQPK
jgi:hypothetical protein